MFNERHRSKTFWTYSLIGFFSLFNFCFDAYSAETKISDADATNIVLSNIAKLDDTGSYPRFSPDGKQILFTKKITKNQDNAQLEIMSLWTMDSDGKNKKVLLENGYNGAWSPDGNRIAYFSLQSFLVGVSHDTLSIYDIIAEKKFELTSVINGYRTSIAWTKDAKGVFYDDCGNQGACIINLDTLNIETSEWNEANLFVATHPKVWIYDESMEEDKDWWSGGKLWIENRDNSFRRLLLREDIKAKSRSVDICPDLSKIVFCIDNQSGIYIADLDVSKDLPIRIFRVEIGRNMLLGGNFINYRERTERFIRESAIYAGIYEPRVNPLNNKTIGPGEKMKAWVKFIKILDNYSIIKIVEETEAVSLGDVITNLKASLPDLGGGGWDIWSVIQTKAEE